MSSVDLSSASASSERAEWAVSCVNAGLTSSLGSLRKDARLRNAHLQDPASDGLVILEQEHDSISSALTQLIQMATRWIEQKSSDPKEVDTLLTQTIALVSQHASKEERYVYPLFATHLKGEVNGVTAAMIYERNVADDDMNKVIMDLLLQMRMEKDGELMRATLMKLQVIEEEHLTQEEHWFALLRNKMTKAELVTLAETIRGASTLAPTRPHSLVGPSHATLARVAHPVAGLVDHIVDSATGRDTGLVQSQGGAVEIQHK